MAIWVISDFVSPHKNNIYKLLMDETPLRKSQDTG